MCLARFAKTEPYPMFMLLYMVVSNYQRNPKKNTRDVYLLPTSKWVTNYR